MLTFFFRDSFCPIKAVDVNAVQFPAIGILLNLGNLIPALVQSNDTTLIILKNTQKANITDAQ